MAFIVGVATCLRPSGSESNLCFQASKSPSNKGHMIFRSVDNPNQFFVRIEFDSAEEARSFAEKVRGSDVLANLSPIVPPTVIELAEQTSY